MSFSLLRRWMNPSPVSPAGGPSSPPDLTEPEADCRAGLRFESGLGVAQDYAQAAQCYAHAAEQNNSLAQYHLASMYGQGHGVARDQAKSLMWLTRSANLGNADAQYRLGVQCHLACRTGRVGSTAEGRIEALKWVRLSAAQGCHGAESACEFVALDMTFDEVAESGRREIAFAPGSIV